MLIALTGCGNDPLAEDYLDGGNTNYISGSGIEEIPVGERADPVAFTGETDTGTQLSEEDFAGQVLVVNFWYAGCAPCRAEAPDLKTLSEKYDGNGAAFLGVNVYDGPAQSLAFAEKYEINYPSLLDETTGKVRLAFAGELAPNAVPTTIVLDREGRVAARILGRIQERSILDTLIRDLIEEPL